MRACIFVLSLSVCLLCAALSMQELSGAVAGKLVECFRQFDRNGDGRLSRQELPMALFDRLNANKDGSVTLEEAKAFFAGGQMSPSSCSTAGDTSFPGLGLTAIWT